MVLAIGDCLEEGFEAWKATDVFGRSPMLALDEARVLDGRFGLAEALDKDRVPPVTAAVASVSEFALASLDQTKMAAWL
ncbi:hypothetical protein SAMN05428963_101263 [Consotaella salsifontis]|uniref:Uncharacterized protein n=1 Tax=Consotaella salsifontis TaxID=1365950 RepID=A0A1T4LL98_9HYPH|nr:hypothetical protein [Consotaella salsifontis]SJZ55337.1 hypothetical protein SAMN05428963_101263 [Consotaella salsifontis]